MEQQNVTTDRPDRYTTLLITHDEIESRVDACLVLGLVWFIENAPGSSRVMMRVFFDEIGKRKYLAGDYN